LGILKTSHHADFDEAWYLQPHCPPAAQLLYNLGLEYEDDGGADKLQEQTASPTDLKAPWPPCLPLPLLKGKWNPPTKCYTAPLPLWKSAMLRPITARAARVYFDPVLATDHEQFPEIQQGPKISLAALPYNFIGVAARTKATLAAELVSEFLITKRDIAPLYMSPCPYVDAFEEVIDLCKFDLSNHRTAGLCLTHINGQLFLGGISPSTPGAKITCWRTRIMSAWLIKIGPTTVSTIEDAQLAFKKLSDAGAPSVVLLFLHPEIRPTMTHDGLPIVSSAPFHQQVHGQLN
jgi:hypothetical protein